MFTIILSFLIEKIGISFIFKVWNYFFPPKFASVRLLTELKFYSYILCQRKSQNLINVDVVSFYLFCYNLIEECRHFEKSSSNPDLVAGIFQEKTEEMANAFNILPDLANDIEVHGSPEWGKYQTLLMCYTPEIWHGVITDNFEFMRYVGATEGCLDMWFRLAGLKPMPLEKY